jgi:hypothetical protein
MEYLRSSANLFSQLAQQTHELRRPVALVVERFSQHVAIGNLHKKTVGVADASEYKTMCHARAGGRRAVIQNELSEPMLSNWQDWNSGIHLCTG